MSDPTQNVHSASNTSDALRLLDRIEKVVNLLQLRYKGTDLFPEHSSENLTKMMLLDGASLLEVVVSGD